MPWKSWVLWKIPIARYGDQRTQTNGHLKRRLSQGTQLNEIDIRQGIWNSYSMKLTINKYIVANSNICHGKPTFAGTRIMVWQVLEMLGSEATTNEILQAYPTLKPAHIKAALDYA